MTERSFLSQRGRALLFSHQRTVAVQLREVQSADRMLTGALTACDGPTQRETVGSYLDAVQELRVSLQRLENFLLQKLMQPHDQAHDHEEAAATSTAEAVEARSAARLTASPE